MSKKQVIKILGHTPGLIKDVNEALNPGYLTFKNFFINSMGKIQKRKGWTFLSDYYSFPNFPYHEIGIAQNFTFTNINDYNFSPHILHIKKTEEIIGTTVTKYLNIIYAIRDVQSTITGLRLNRAKLKLNADGTKTIISNTTINTSGQFISGWDGLDFIETNDQLYIINHSFVGTVANAVMKYDYDLIDSLHNVSIVGRDSTFPYGNVAPVIRGTLLTGDGGDRTRTCAYAVTPVYNTGTEGGVIQAVEITFTRTYQSVNIEIDSATPFYSDQYIIGYNIYRIPEYTPPTHYYTTFQNTITWRDFYFLYYVDKPVGTGWVVLKKTSGPIGVGGPFYDATSSTKLTKVPTSYTVNGQTTYDYYSTLYGIKATCGTYANNRLMLGGDPAFPKLLYLSEIDATDVFEPDIAMSIPLAALDNMQTAIKEIGDNIFIFCKKSIDRLTQTGDTSVPYIRQTISVSLGIDHAQSVAIINNVGYFVSNKKLWAINRYGTIKEIGVAINTYLDDIDTADGSFFVLKANEKNMSLRIMYKDSDDAIRNVIFYTLEQIISTESGECDVFATGTGTYNGKTKLTLTTNVEDDFGLLGYEYNKSMDSEYGMTKYGEITERLNTAAYTDTSSRDRKYEWGNLIFEEQFTTGTNATASYPVKGVVEKSFYFDSDVILNGVTFYGTGNLKVQMAMNADAYTTAEEITLTAAGVFVSFNGEGSNVKIKLTHDYAVNIDYDYMDFMITAKNKVKIKNNVDGD